MAHRAQNSVGLLFFSEAKASAAWRYSPPCAPQTCQSSSRPNLS